MNGQLIQSLPESQDGSRNNDINQSPAHYNILYSRPKGSDHPSVIPRGGRRASPFSDFRRVFLEVLKEGWK